MHDDGHYHGQRNHQHGTAVHEEECVSDLQDHSFEIVGFDHSGRNHTDCFVYNILCILLEGCRNPVSKDRVGAYPGGCFCCFCCSGLQFCDDAEPGPDLCRLCTDHESGGLPDRILWSVSPMHQIVLSGDEQEENICQGRNGSVEVDSAADG